MRPTQLGRFRWVLGEAGVEELLSRTMERVIVDTTVQAKAIAHPTDGRHLEVARVKVVKQAQRAGIAQK